MEVKKAKNGVQVVTLLLLYTATLDRAALLQTQKVLLIHRTLRATKIRKRRRVSLKKTKKRRNQRKTRSPRRKRKRKSYLRH